MEVQKIVYNIPLDKSDFIPWTLRGCSLHSALGKELHLQFLVTIILPEAHSLTWQKNCLFCRALYRFKTNYVNDPLKYRPKHVDSSHTYQKYESSENPLNKKSIPIYIFFFINSKNVNKNIIVTYDALLPSVCKQHPIPIDTFPGILPYKWILQNSLISMWTLIRKYFAHINF